MDIHRPDKVNIGIDIGSVSVDSIILNEEYHILQDLYVRHKGKPVETTLSVIKKIVEQFGEESIKRLAFTGAGSREIAKAMDPENTYMQNRSSTRHE